MAPSTPITALGHIHFTGIKGVGMTSLALCTQDLGIKITGSDVKEEFVTDATLKRRGIKWKVGFSPGNLDPKPDLVIFTGAHGGFQNPEVMAAKEMGIPVMSHAQALGEFAKGKDAITVCGVGGKSTTASMIATTLDVARRSPSFAIGVADIFSLRTPGRYTRDGREFVCEADEFAISPDVDNRPRWSYLEPRVIVVTNIEHDHPDIYPSFENTKRVFKSFFEKIPKDGLLVACIDNPNVVEIIKNINVPVTTYGFSDQADWQIVDLRVENQENKFSLIHSSQKHGFTLKVPGRFNVTNATAAFVVAQFLGLSAEEGTRGIANYAGCRRRVEKVAEKDGVLYYDDYAHHPTEIRAAISAIRDWCPDRRIIAVFQPHTYSRTKALFEEFAQSFRNASEVILTDVYASARETDTLGVNSEKLAEAVKKYHNHVRYSGTKENTVAVIREMANPGDIVLTMGAGDIFQIHSLLGSQGVPLRT